MLIPPPVSECCLEAVLHNHNTHYKDFKLTGVSCQSEAKHLSDRCPSYADDDAVSVSAGTGDVKQTFSLWW